MRSREDIIQSLKNKQYVISITDLDFHDLDKPRISAERAEYGLMGAEVRRDKNYINNYRHFLIRGISISIKEILLEEGLFLNNFHTKQLWVEQEGGEICYSLVDSSSIETDEGGFLHNIVKPLIDEKLDVVFFHHGEYVNTVEQYREYIPREVRLGYIDHPVSGKTIRESLL